MPKYWARGLFFVLSIGYVFCHYWIFKNLNLKYIDSDQPYMWAAWQDFSNFKFYEPRFYGQNYNTHFESLLALVFRNFTKNPFIAIPLATHAIKLVFTLFVGFYYLFQKKHTTALIWMGFWMLLPAEYDIMCSLPRGFVTGFWFLIPLIMWVENPESKPWKRLAMISCVMGCFIHPGILFVVLPVWVYVYAQFPSLLYQWKFDLGLCILWFILGYGFFEGFYLIHPECIKNDLKTGFSFQNGLVNVFRLDTIVSYITPLFTSQSWILFVLLWALWYFKASFSKRVAFFVFLILFLFALCSNKSMEGAHWLFMPFSRLYLYVPVVIAIGLITFNRWPNAWVITLVLSALLYGGFKCVHSYKRAIQTSMDEQQWVGVRLYEQNKLKTACDWYTHQLKQDSLTTLVFSKNHWLKNPISYGLNAINNSQKYLNSDGLSEKRYWIRNQLHQVQSHTFLYQSSRYDLAQCLPPKGVKILARDDYGLVRVTTTQRSIWYFLTWANTQEP